MKRWAALFMLGCLSNLVGCTVVVQNTDSFQHPVVLTWSADPSNGQPNPGQLEAGYQAEFQFSTSSVSLNGYDPQDTQFTDDIDLELQLGAVRVVEWDGFQFIDRGNQRVSLATWLGLLTGNVNRIEPPSAVEESPDPAKRAAAQ